MIAFFTSQGDSYSVCKTALPSKICRSQILITIGIISNLFDAVLKNVTIVSDAEYEIDESFKNKMEEKVTGTAEKCSAGKGV